MNIIKLEYKISNEDISDILVTAFEGGINYWCGKIIHMNKKSKYIASDAIAANETLILVDVEDDNEKWILTKEKLLNGIIQFIEQENVILFEKGIFQSINVDADIADSIIQYSLFNEVIFS